MEVENRRELPALEEPHCIPSPGMVREVVREIEPFRVVVKGFVKHEPVAGRAVAWRRDANLERPFESGVVLKLDSTPNRANAGAVKRSFRISGTATAPAGYVKGGRQIPGRRRWQGEYRKGTGNERQALHRQHGRASAADRRGLRAA